MPPGPDAAGGGPPGGPSLETARRGAGYGQLLEEGVEEIGAAIPGFGSFIAPKSLIWELTGKCELRCPFCFGSYPRRFDDELSREEKLALARELAGAKLFGINLSGGEPLLCPELPEIVGIFRDADIPVMIVTSGFNLTPELAAELMRHPELGLCFSIDAPDAEVHDRLRGRPGAFERAVSAIRTVNGLADAESPPALLVESVVVRENLGSVERLIDMARELGVVHLRIQAVVNVGREGAAAALALSEEELHRLRSTVIAARDRMYDDVRAGRVPPTMQINFVDQSSHVIHGLQSGRNPGGVILPDGTLKVSAYLPYTFGNIRTLGGLMGAWRAGFKIAWRHPVLRRELAGTRTIKDLERVAAARDYREVALDLSEVAA